jgi:hypothetical protein
LGPQFGNPIWDPDLGGDMGPPFGTLSLGGDRDPDLGGDMGPTFRTPILELFLNVISKIKQNSSDMNDIILAPCDVISKIKQILVI